MTSNSDTHGLLKY